MTNYLYCIEHEHMTIAQESPVGICHEYYEFDDGDSRITGIDWCFYDEGFAYCEPPEYDPDWDLNLEEPTDILYNPSIQ